MNIPVAFIIFNRPEKTRSVFTEIAKAKPRKLFVIADGPRKDHPSDIQKCQDARSVIDDIDWECEVFKNFADENLGCGKRPATGISWVFDHVDRSIILEDDCLPHPTFFRFCDELLEKYKDNPKIMQINGSNLQLEKKRTADSYYFSSANICWGWATWRRAWDCYDINIEKWPQVKKGTWLMDIVNDREAAEYWGQIFDHAYEGAGDVSYWDYQWRFSFWLNNGFAISPRDPLISNIGFDNSGTHTIYSNDPYANIQTRPMTFPLRHPAEIKCNEAADRFLTDRLPIKNKSKPSIRMGQKLFRKIIRRLRRV